MYRPNLLLSWLVGAMAIAVASTTLGNANAASAPYCEPSLRASLLAAARSSPSAVQDDGSLYGVQRWNTWTRRDILGMSLPGLLSCAYTVSAIFQGACHPIGKLASVSAVDAALSRWQKIDVQADVAPGDVVFWRPRTMPVLHRVCGAHWHVGIATGKNETLDNDWWTGKPAIHGLTRLCVAFAWARRPPG